MFRVHKPQTKPNECSRLGDVRFLFTTKSGRGLHVFTFLILCGSQVLATAISAMARAHAVFRECVAAIFDPNVLVTVFTSMGLSVVRIAFILHVCRPSCSQKRACISRLQQAQYSNRFAVRVYLWRTVLSTFLEGCST